MRVNRGCGCLLLILAALNCLLLVLAVVGLARGSFGSVALGVLAVVLFGANLVAALMLGLAGFRGRAINAASGLGEAAVAEEEGEKAVDEGID